jgi:hypothetical protein
MLSNTHVGHKFLAGDPYIFSKSSAEHHDLFVMGGNPEYFLNIPPHI